MLHITTGYQNYYRSLQVTFEIFVITVATLSSVTTVATATTVTTVTDVTDLTTFYPTPGTLSES